MSGGKTMQEKDRRKGKWVNYLFGKTEGREIEIRQRPKVEALALVRKKICKKGKKIALLQTIVLIKVEND